MDCQIIIMIFQVTSLVTAHSQVGRSYFSPGYIGCFNDRGTRILPISLDHSKTNTGRECTQRCKQKGYRYGGTEASDQCFCGEKLNRTKVPHAECQRICSGNSSEYCGGNWRIAVYDNDAANNMKRQPGYLGCFKDANKEDGTKQRTMSHEMYKDCATNTGNQCKRRCKIRGYTYAGTEYGTECFCGNTLPVGKVLDTECYYTCPGDRNEYCGAKTTPNMSTSTPISTISSSTISQVSTAQELSSITSYYMTSTSTALRSRLMPTSSTVSVLTFSRYSETEPKVSFPTTPQHSSYLQTSELLTTDKTTSFTSTSVSTGRVSASSANAISASSSTSRERNQSIFQMRPEENTNFAAQNISRNVWVRINDKLLLVVERKESFSNARNICMDMGAELLAYSNPMRFFQPSIDQILINNLYWLGVYMDKLGMECPLLYNKNNVSSFRLDNCSNNNQFICSKSSNVTDEAESLEFEELLKDMTVKRLDTSKTKRKLVSAKDKRKSSKSIGAFGILIIFAFIAFFVLIDITRRKNHFVKKKK